MVGGVRDWEAAVLSSSLGAGKGLFTAYRMSSWRLLKLLGGQGKMLLVVVLVVRGGEFRNFLELGLGAGPCAKATMDVETRKQTLQHFTELSLCRVVLACLHITRPTSHKLPSPTPRAATPDPIDTPWHIRNERASDVEFPHTST